MDGGTMRYYSKNNQTSGEGEIVCGPTYRIRYTYWVKAKYNKDQETAAEQNDCWFEITFYNTGDQVYFRLNSNELWDDWTYILCADPNLNPSSDGTATTGSGKVKLSSQPRSVRINVSNLHTTRKERMYAGTKDETIKSVDTDIPCDVSFDIKLPASLKPVAAAETQTIKEEEKDDATLVFPSASGVADGQNIPDKEETKPVDDFWNEGGSNKTTNTTTNTTSSTISQQYNNNSTQVTNAQVAEQYRQQAEQRRLQQEQQNREQEESRQQEEERRKQEQLEEAKQYADQLERRTQSDVRVVNDAINSVTDVIVADIMRAADEAEEARLERLEEKREEEEKWERERRERDEQRRKTQMKLEAQSSFLNSVPALVPTDNYANSLLKEVYYLFMIRNEDRLFLSDPFLVKRYSDDTWPYKFDIIQKVEIVANGNPIWLLGYYTTKAEALQMLNALTTEAENSYFTTQKIQFSFKDYSATQVDEPSEPSTPNGDFWKQ